MSDPKAQNTVPNTAPNSQEDRDQHSQAGGKSGPLAKELGDTKRTDGNGEHKGGANGTGGPGGTGGSVL